jgi:hypothetical protein
VVTGAASNVTSNGATISGTVNPNGSLVSSAIVEYGLTTSYGATANVSPARQRNLRRRGERNAQRSPTSSNLSLSHLRDESNCDQHRTRWHLYHRRKPRRSSRRAHPQT